MKSLLKFPLLVAVATMMSCSFSACSDNDDPTPDTGTSETDAKFEAVLIKEQHSTSVSRHLLSFVTSPVS